MALQCDYIEQEAAEGESNRRDCDVPAAFISKPTSQAWHAMLRID